MRFDFQKIVFCFFVLIVSVAPAQNIEKIGQKDMFKVGGGLNFSSIGYSAYGMPSRRVPYAWYLSGSLSVSVIDWSIPFSYSYSNQQSTFTQPFNKVSLAPQYKWFKSYIGFNSMTFSSYTLAGYIFAGGGIELTPGNWRISAMCGRLNAPVPYNAVAGSDANMAYKRLGYGTKIGYEKNGSALHLILFRAGDDPSSIPFIPLNTQVTPKENMVIGVIGKTKLNTHFSLEGEYALSGLTRNVLSDIETNPNRKNYLPGLFTMHSTSQFFSAYKTALGYNARQFNIQLKYERVDPDYQTLGAYYFNNDMENITVSPSFKLLNGKINCSLNSGFQRNNLDKTKLNDTHRFVNAANIAITLNNKLSMYASCSNFSSYTKTRPQNDPFFYNTLDTLNFYQVTKSANVGTNYSFGESKLKQAILFAASYQVSGQATTTQAAIPTVVYSGNVGYTINWQPAKTTANIALNVNRSEMTALNTIYYGPNFTLGKNLINNTMRISAGSTFNRALSNGKINNNIFNSRITLNYSPKVKNTIYGKPALGFTCNYLMRLPTDQNNTKSGELTLTINLSYAF